MLPKPYKVGAHTVLHPNLVLTTYTTWNGSQTPGSHRQQALGPALLELHCNDLRTGCSPIASYFGAIAKMAAGDQLTVDNPNGYVHHFSAFQP